MLLPLGSLKPQPEQQVFVAALRRGALWDGASRRKKNIESGLREWMDEGGMCSSGSRIPGCVQESLYTVFLCYGDSRCHGYNTNYMVIVRRRSCFFKRRSRL